MRISRGKGVPKETGISREKNYPRGMIDPRDDSFRRMNISGLINDGYCEDFPEKQHYKLHQSGYAVPRQSNCTIPTNVQETIFHNNNGGIHDISTSVVPLSLAPQLPSIDYSVTSLQNENNDLKKIINTENNNSYFQRSSETRNSNHYSVSSVNFHQQNHALSSCRNIEGTHHMFDKFSDEYCKNHKTSLSRKDYNPDRQQQLMMQNVLQKHKFSPINNKLENIDALASYNNHTLLQATLTADPSFQSRTASISRSGKKKRPPKHIWKEVLPPTVPSEADRWEDNGQMAPQNCPLSLHSNRNVAVQTDMNKLQKKHSNEPLSKESKKSLEKNRTSKHDSLCCWSSPNELPNQRRYERNVQNSAMNVRSREFTEENPYAVPGDVALRRNLELRADGEQTIDDVLELSEREKVLDAWVPSSCLQSDRLGLIERMEKHEMLRSLGETKEMSATESDISAGIDEVDVRYDRRIIEDTFEGVELDARSDFRFFQMNNDARNLEARLTERKASENLDEFKYLTYGSEIDDQEDYRSKYRRLVQERSSTSSNVGNEAKDWRELRAGKLNSSGLSVKQTAMMVPSPAMSQPQPRMARKIRLSSREWPTENGKKDKASGAESQIEAHRKVPNETLSYSLPAESYKNLIIEAASKNSMESNRIQNIEAEEVLPIKDIKQMIQHFEHQSSPSSELRGKILPKSENSPDDRQKNRRYIKNTKHSLKSKRGRDKMEEHPPSITNTDIGGRYYFSRSHDDLSHRLSLNSPASGSNEIHAWARRSAELQSKNLKFYSSVLGNERLHRAYSDTNLISEEERKTWLLEKGGSRKEEVNAQEIAEVGGTQEKTPELRKNPVASFAINEARQLSALRKDFSSPEVQTRNFPNLRGTWEQNTEQTVGRNSDGKEHRLSEQIFPAYWHRTTQMLQENNPRDVVDEAANKKRQRNVGFDNTDVIIGTSSYVTQL